MNHNNKKYILGTIVAILLLSVGVTYAYWRANIKGEGANVSVTFGDVSIIFTDTIEIVEEDVMIPWSTTKTFTVKNEGTQEFFYDINIKDLINTLVTEDYLQYKITSTNGYNMTEYKSINKSETPTTQVLGSYISIPGKSTQEYTIEFRYVEDPEVNQSEDMGKTFGGKLQIVEGVKPATLYDKLLSDNPSHTGSRPNAFDGIYTEENTGVMYVASGNQTEDGSNVYYFAGNALNNWVKFGKNEQDEDLYWRIIRTNEDGSVRMLYAGTSPSTTTGYIDSQIYNVTRNNPMYVGYMYGTSDSLANNRKNTTSSDIKTTIDNWYASGLNEKVDTDGNKYDAYISKTAIYCNDRAHEGTYSTSTTFNYAAYYRLTASNSSYANTGSNKASFKCGNDVNGNLYSTGDTADKFSQSTTEGGNGQLQYPVALMTADEISFAGGLWVTISPAWFYYNSESESVTGSTYWWTMTPYSYSSSNNYAYVFYERGSSNPGHLGYNNVSASYGVRPVISIKSCAKWKSGNGASSTPYEVELNNSCALSEN